ncbi:MAG: M28 family metallopeptidase [Actinomycetota bacterium]|nr:M28 family metallopeptidase [Actinomycetota bacterium]
MVDWSFSRHLEQCMARLAAPAFLAILSACSAADTPPTPALDGDRLMGHITMLASDSFLGRAPGSLGEERTVEYLEREFRALGLQPGNPDGTYIQNVPLVGITGDPAMVLTIEGRGVPQQLRFRDEFVAWSRHVTDSVRVSGSELVFIGYGTKAPEFSWDDLKGADLQGKTLVVLVNDPPLADTTQFGGRAMTYYGRWTYKYEQAAALGAAGMLIIHEDGPAGYPWGVVQGMGGEKFDLVTPDRNLGRAPMEGWIHLDVARRLLALAGQDFDSLKARAATREFTPVPLGLTASLGIRNTLRTLDSRNVVAKVEGSDPVLRDEYVIYTAHWDHFGVGDAVDGDSIYNGAADNASGTAGLLEMARAFQELPTKPRRSVLFLAVTAEEQGLLGSEYYARTPLHPLAKTVANINVDVLNMDGRTSDLVVIGLGASELDDYLREAAGVQGRAVLPDPESEKGFYYRSDHFNFAKVGVPALYTDVGVTFEGQPAGYGAERSADWNTNRYHKPSDEVLPSWKPDGAIQDLELFFRVGYRVAQADSMPRWAPGNEFRARREASLSGR